MISDTNTPYGSCVRLQGKSLALSEYHSSNVETVAETFLWCGVTPSKYSQPARQGKAGQPGRKAGKNTSMFRWLTKVSQVVVAIGRSHRGIQFSALDDKSVNLVVLFLVPTDQFQKHVNTLANIAKLLHREDFRNGLWRRFM